MKDAAKNRNIRLFTANRPVAATPTIPGALLTALSTSEVTYTLGFYADSKQARDGFHKIAVSLVNHPGVSLRYRKGYEDIREPASEGTNREPVSTGRDGAL